MRAYKYSAVLTAIFLVSAVLMAQQTPPVQPPPAQTFKVTVTGDSALFQAAVGGVVGHGPEGLGGQDVFAAPVLGQDLSQKRLRLPALVDVRGVEGVDAQREGLLDDLAGGVQLHLVPEGEPGSIGDGADRESGISKLSVFHVRKGRKF